MWDDKSVAGLRAHDSRKRNRVHVHTRVEQKNTQVIRTPEELADMQDNSLEQAIWNGVLRVNKTREHYAVEVARAVVKLLERTRLDRVGARGLENATMDVLELAYENRWLYGMIRTYAVEAQHVELAKKLVQQYMRTRCMRILGQDEETVVHAVEDRVTPPVVTTKPIGSDMPNAAQLIAKLKAKWQTKVTV